MHDPDPHISDRLVHDLRRLEHHPAWPEDDPVLAAARVQLTGPRVRGSRRLAGWSAGLAAAAALAVAAVVWLNQPSRQGPLDALASGPASPVTMLDAYRLTLILDRRETPSPAWDADGDGSVDRTDVDALAARAVSLGEVSS